MCETGFGDSLVDGEPDLKRANAPWEPHSYKGGSSSLDMRASSEGQAIDASLFQRLTRYSAPRLSAQKLCQISGHNT